MKARRNIDCTKLVAESNTITTVNLTITDQSHRIRMRYLDHYDIDALVVFLDHIRHGDHHSIYVKDYAIAFFPADRETLILDIDGGNHMWLQTNPAHAHKVISWLKHKVRPMVCDN